MSVSNDFILDRRLTADEKAKFDRVKDRFSAIFTAAGHVVRVCEGTGEAGRRIIGFLPGLVGPPLVSVPADQFLSASDEELLTALKRTLNGQ
jgi:hypothetical protein